MSGQFLASLSLLSLLVPAVLAAPSNTKTAVIIPASCPYPTSWTVSNFNFFNSTHNLDCVTGPDVGDGTTCFNSTSSGTVTCDPRLGPCENCGVPACFTGLPAQPLGYGPPDKVAITINGQTCIQSNPQTVHRYEVGEGFVSCGGAAPVLEFFGSSNAAQGTGTINYHPFQGTCPDGKSFQASGTGTFSYTCIYDAGRNATCTAAPFQIPVTSFTVV
jgi:hypothetical protein